MSQVSEYASRSIFKIYKLSRTKFRPKSDFLESFLQFFFAVDKYGKLFIAIKIAHIHSAFSWSNIMLGSAMLRTVIYGP